MHTIKDWSAAYADSLHKTYLYDTRQGSFYGSLINWLKFPKVWRAFACVSVAHVLIKLYDSGQTEPAGSLSGAEALISLV